MCIGCSLDLLVSNIRKYKVKLWSLVAGLLVLKIGSRKYNSELWSLDLLLPEIQKDQVKLWTLVAGFACA